MSFRVPQSIISEFPLAKNNSYPNILSALTYLQWSQVKLLGEAIMKTATKKSFAIFSLLTLLIFGVSMNSFAASAAEPLASEFENLAKEMHAKVDEISHKSRSRYFGKNARRHKSRVTNKIRKYEKAASEYAEQAAHHHQLAAGQSELNSVSNQNQTDLSSNL